MLSIPRLRKIAFLLPAQLVWVLVDIAVMANFMADSHDQLNRPWIALDAPARDEETLPHPNAGEHVNDARDCHLRTIA
jgi:hypothetical protein